MITSPYNTSMPFNQLVLRNILLRNLYPFKPLKCNIDPTTY
jgi:hypothetical protein